MSAAVNLDLNDTRWSVRDKLGTEGKCAENTTGICPESYWSDLVVVTFYESLPINIHVPMRISDSGEIKPSLYPGTLLGVRIGDDHAQLLKRWPSAKCEPDIAYKSLRECSLYWVDYGARPTTLWWDEDRHGRVVDMTLIDGRYITYEKVYQR